MRLSIQQMADKHWKKLIKIIEDSPFEKEQSHEIRKFLISDAVNSLISIEMSMYVLNKIHKGSHSFNEISYLLYNKSLPSTVELIEVQQMIARIQIWFPHLRIPDIVKKNLKVYQDIATSGISLHVDIDGDLLTWKSVSSFNREAIYNELFTKPIPYEPQPLQTIKQRKVLIPNGKQEPVLIKLPNYFLSSALTEPYLERLTKKSIQLTKQDLIDAARAMDKCLDKAFEAAENYESRIQQILISENNSQLIQVDKFLISSTQHWVGPLNIGKSTFMRVISYALTKKEKEKHRITLIVKDLKEVFELVNQLQKINVKAVPYMSPRKRTEHIKKLTSLYNSKRQEKEQIQLFMEPMFKYVSDNCPLENYYTRDENVDEPPCLKMVEVKDNLGNRQNFHSKNIKCVCPYFQNCPRNKMYHDLPTAEVIVTTMQSIIKTQTSPVLSPYKMSMLEYIYQNSTLVLMDEVDQIQVSLDDEFIPNMSIIQHDYEADLYKIEKTVQQELSRNNRLKWTDLKYTLLGLTNIRLCAEYIQLLLEQDRSKEILKNFIGTREFSSFRLLDKFCYLLDKETKNNNQPSKLNEIKKDIFKFYKEISENADQNQTMSYSWHQQLVEFMNHRDMPNIEPTIELWLINYFNRFNLEIPRDAIPEFKYRLILSLNILYLERQLSKLSTDYWSLHKVVPDNYYKAVSVFSNRREMYDGIVDLHLIGPLFGFSYKYNQQLNSGGKLLVSRYKGIGRQLMLKFSQLFEPFDTEKGPPTILLSATSVASKSYYYDVPIPVSYLLNNTKRRPSLYYEMSPLFDEEGHKIFISGRFEDKKENYLKMAKALFNSDGKQSLIDQWLVKMPEHRQRLMLVVQSYEDAKILYESIMKQFPNEKRVCYLVRDTEDISEYRNQDILARGAVNTITDFDYQILIFPMGALERGHNILTEIEFEGYFKKEAAFGGLAYCVRPYPPADLYKERLMELNYQSITQDTKKWNKRDSFKQEFEDIRKKHFETYQKISHITYGYEALNDDERYQLLLNTFVRCNQLEGRLIRGDVDAFVYFLDAAFMPEKNEGEIDTAKTSMLLGWIDLAKKLQKEQPEGVIKALFGMRIEALLDFEQRSKLSWEKQLSY